MLTPRLPLLALSTLGVGIVGWNILTGQGLLPGLLAQAQTQVPRGADISNANAISLTAIPPRIGDTGEIKIKPGEKFQTTVRILNTSDIDLDVETFIQDFVIDVDGKTPIPVRESVEDRWSLASWVILTPSNQTIPAKKTVSVSVLIDVPKDARPGGHYAMILHQPSRVGAGAEDQSNTGVNQQVGSLLYVNVDGPIDELAFIRGFAFKPNWAEFGPLEFFYSVDNQSDIHVRPTGTVNITDIFNRKVGEINVETQNVFPGAQRAFMGTWPVKWGFGPYTAILNITYGDHGQIAVSKTVVWLLPITIIITILILLLSLITGLVIIKRRRDTRSEPPTSPPSQVSVDTTAPPSTQPMPPLV